MKISSIRDFRDRATALFRSDDPILVTRRGKVAGVFLPWHEASLPVDFKRELFAMLSAEIGRQLKKKDRKSTRLNSSHGYISYAVFCLKKKKKKHNFLCIIKKIKLKKHN